MTPEQLKLADCPLCHSSDLHRFSHWTSCDDGMREIKKIVCAGCQCEAPEFHWNTRALRATPDARVKEALDYIKMADNRLECEGCGQCVSVARSYLVEALAALSHQPGTGEAAALDNAPKSPALDTATVEAAQDFEEYPYDDERFNKGVDLVVQLLAKTIGAEGWHAGDGSEDYEQDLAQTLLNILSARGLYDRETGEFVTAAPGALDTATVEALERACKLMKEELAAECTYHTLRKTWNEVEVTLAAALAAKEGA